MNSHACKPFTLLFVVLTLAMTAAAQDTQRFETFAGYSFTHDSSFAEPGTNYSGWDTSTTVFFNRWIGFASDFSGHYGGQTFPVLCSPGGCFDAHASVNSYTYLFGPHFKYQRSRYAPFAQMLFGVHRSSEVSALLSSPGCSSPSNCGTVIIGPTHPYTKFAMAVGGGLDVAIGHGFSIRPVQAEYLLLRQPSVDSDLLRITVNNNVFRYSTGITFHFGQHLGTNK